MDYVLVQLYSLTERNRVLMEKLQKTKKEESATVNDTQGGDNKDIPFSGLDLNRNSESEIQEEVPIESTSKHLKACAPFDSSYSY